MSNTKYPRSVAEQEEIVEKQNSKFLNSAAELAEMGAERIREVMVNIERDNLDNGEVLEQCASLLREAASLFEAASLLQNVVEVGGLLKCPSCQFKAPLSEYLRASKAGDW